jgi:hypothetical protein
MRILILGWVVFTVAAGWACESHHTTSREDPNETKNDTFPPTDIKFLGSQEFRFGKIKQGEQVTHQFEFQNVGKNPLKIYRASASCGCTTPDYPKGLIQPGEKGRITVVFNSAGKEGKQKKRATIVVNTPKKYYDLYLLGEVVDSESKPDSKKK